MNVVTVFWFNIGIVSILVPVVVAIVAAVVTMFVRRRKIAKGDSKPPSYLVAQNLTIISIVVIAAFLSPFGVGQGVPHVVKTVTAYESQSGTVWQSMGWSRTYVAEALDASGKRHTISCPASTTTFTVGDGAAVTVTKTVTTHPNPYLISTTEEREDVSCDFTITQEETDGLFIEVEE